MQHQVVSSHHPINAPCSIGVAKLAEAFWEHMLTMVHVLTDSSEALSGQQGSTPWMSASVGN